MLQAIAIFNKHLYLQAWNINRSSTERKGQRDRERTKERKRERTKERKRDREKTKEREREKEQKRERERERNSERERKIEKNDRAIEAQMKSECSSQTDRQDKGKIDG